MIGISPQVQRVCTQQPQALIVAMVDKHTSAGRMPSKLGVNAGVGNPQLWMLLSGCKARVLPAQTYL